MHAIVQEARNDLGALCRRFGVERLDVFGSAARGQDFDAANSDIDFIVSFETSSDGLAPFLEFQQALEGLFERPIDLVDRREIETSRNYIRRRLILEGAEPVYAA